MTIWVCTLYVGEMDSEEHYFSTHEKAKDFLRRKFEGRLKEDESYPFKDKGSVWDMYFTYGEQPHEGYCRIRKHELDKE